MSAWTKIKEAVVIAARATANVVNELGNALSVPFEALGVAIENGCNWLGNKVGIAPVFSWLGGVIKGPLTLVAAIIKGVVGVIAGILGGAIRLIGGLLTLQFRVLLDGIWDFFSPTLGTIVVILGKLIGWIQTLFYLQVFERPLTPEEQAYLEGVYGKSLNCYLIRLVEGRSGLYGVSSRPFTMGNTIYMKYSLVTTDLLVHESMHAWQFQEINNRYTSDAIVAQWFVADAYNWRKEIEERNKQDWRDFNLEGQAEFFQDLWRGGQLKDADGNNLGTGQGVFFNADGSTTFGFFLDLWSGSDYTNIAREALAIVRRG